MKSWPPPPSHTHMGVGCFPDLVAARFSIKLMETITQRSRHSRRVSMTCYLINKTASVLRPKFSRGCAAECLPDTGDAAAINKRIIVRNTPGIGKQKQLHAGRQTCTYKHI